MFTGLEKSMLVPSVVLVGVVAIIGDMVNGAVLTLEGIISTICDAIPTFGGAIGRSGRGYVCRARRT